MPIQKLQFRPGINRENTSYANEGGYYAANKIRFRSGQPEKVGGWTADTGTNFSALKPTTGTVWGVCRALWNWLNLTGYNLLALGTNLKYYIQSGTNGGLSISQRRQARPKRPYRSVYRRRAFTRVRAVAAGTNVGALSRSTCRRWSKAKSLKAQRQSRLL